MKLLWSDYAEATGHSDLLAHCNESLDEHGKNTLKQLIQLKKYIENIPLLDILPDRKLVSLLEELTYFHDVGKGNPLFQKNLNKLCANRKASLPSHSEDGFLKILEYISPKCLAEENDLMFFVFLLSTIIERHHSDLKNLNDYKIYQSSVDIAEFYPTVIEQMGKNRKYVFYFVYRLFYSLLKTADQRASSYGNKIDDINRTVITSDKLRDYRRNLEKYLQSLEVKNSILAKHRSIFKDIARKKINNIVNENSSARIFFLYLPTGGGKTLTSLSMSLDLVEKINLKRIFYVFPYINIIEQNTAILKQIFRKDIFPIHSFSDFTEFTGDESEEEADYRHVLDIETLNFPAIVMSSVRFFDILFSQKKKSVIKTWSLSNSVIIIDEVQYFPKKYWESLITILTEFGKLFNTYFILMSATLPKLELFLDNKSKNRVSTIIKKEDIIYESKYFESRSNIKNLEIPEKENILDTIASKTRELINRNNKVLVVVNNIENSKKIYEKMLELEDVDIFLLNSTLIYPRRLEILESIEKNNNKKLLISTQSIEAGVDISFDAGIREKAPPESIIQVLGRINREFTADPPDLYVTSSSNSMRFVYKDFYNLGIQVKPEYLNESNEIDKYFDKVVEKLRNMGLESSKLLEDVRYLKFKTVGQNHIIQDNETKDIFFKSIIKIKNNYKIKKNQINVGKKIILILSKTNCFKDTFESYEDYILLNTKEFAKKYDLYISSLSELTYNERFKHLVYLKQLNYIWKMFCFSLRWFNEDIINLLEVDEKGRLWIGDFYSFENGIDNSKLNRIIW